jgi:hypothetical protein
MLNPFKRQFKICKDDIFAFKGYNSKFRYTVWERSLSTLYMWSSCQGNNIFLTLEDAKDKIAKLKEPMFVEVWRE